MFQKKKILDSTPSHDSPLPFYGQTLQVSVCLLPPFHVSRPSFNFLQPGFNLFCSVQSHVGLPNWSLAPFLFLSWKRKHHKTLDIVDSSIWRRFSWFSCTVISLLTILFELCPFCFLFGELCSSIYIKKFFGHMTDIVLWLAFTCLSFQLNGQDTVVSLLFFFPQQLARFSGTENMFSKCSLNDQVTG